MAVAAYGNYWLAVDKDRTDRWAISALPGFGWRAKIDKPTFQLRNIFESELPRFMKEQYVNAFLFPATVVWGSELHTDLEFVGAMPRRDRKTMSDVCVLVRVTGDLVGWVSYELRKKDALRIVSAMIAERVYELDELGHSALGEVANMITGNAATGLETAGYSCDLKPPEFLTGIGREFPPTPAEIQIRADFRSSVGVLAVRIALGESRIGEIAA
ncbi:MAG: chemotaxis protein CheX [Chloroflexi bacterium]|nr:chemotaxis protein CheX [Chloroflexota bacterium]